MRKYIEVDVDGVTVGEIGPFDEKTPQSAIDSFETNLIGLDAGGIASYANFHTWTYDDLSGKIITAVYTTDTEDWT